MGETIESQATAWIAVLAVAVLGVVALACGYDGDVVASCVAVLAALGGAKIATAARRDLV